MAAAIGKMTSTRVSDIIRGVRGIRRQHVIERVADGFGIPGDMLGLPKRPWEGPAKDGRRSDLFGAVTDYGDNTVESSGEEDTDVDRRQFLGAAAVTATGGATLPGIAESR